MIGFLIRFLDYLFKNPPVLALATVLFSTLVSVLVSVYFAPRITQRIRRADEKRDEHLAEIKHNLFYPMAAYLGEHMLPILSLQLGNVGIERRRLPQPSASLTEESRVIAESFCFREAGEPPIDPSMYPNENAKAGTTWEGALYDDASQNHFRDFCRSWEELLTVFDRYNNSCIEYVQKLRSEIIHGSSLPEFDLGGGRTPRWVYARILAIIIYYRQIRLETFQFSRITPAEASSQSLRYKLSQ